MSTLKPLIGYGWDGVDYAVNADELAEERRRLPRGCHDGMTTSERIAAGCATLDDMRWFEEHKDGTRKWHESPEGQEFLEGLKERIKI